MITPDLLGAATGCTPERALLYARAMSEACTLFEINTSSRLAMFLANVGHESASLAKQRESMDYAADRLVSVFGPHRITAAQADALGRKPGRPADQQGIANHVYGGAWGAKNLANTEPGDGWRYRAAGPIGTTGRANFRELKAALLLAGYEDVPDFEAEPERLTEPRWGAAAAGHFWSSRDLNAWADRGDFLAVCRGINLGNPKSGGTPNGMPDREQRLVRARAALAASQAAPTPIQPPASAPAPVRGIPAGEFIPEEPTMAPALLLTLGSALIDVFTPLAREKIQKEIGRHTDNPEVAAQIATAAVETAKAITGKTDPIAATAEVQATPDLLAKVETSALDELAKMGPLLERLHAMDRQDRADSEASMNAAAARARDESEDMAPKLADRAFIVYMTVFLATLGMIGLQIWLSTDHKPAGELVGFFIAVATLGAKQWEKLFEYRFGSSRGSSNKDAVIAQVSQRNRGV